MNDIQPIQSISKQYLHSTSPKIPAHNIHWNFTVPPDNEDGTYMLLTIAGIATSGEWQGELGEYFVGWAYSTQPEALH
jgi:hypothetical protein